MSGGLGERSIDVRVGEVGVERDGQDVLIGPSPSSRNEMMVASAETRRESSMQAGSGRTDSTVVTWYDVMGLSRPYLGT